MFLIFLYKRKRSSRYPALEKRLFSWIQEERAKGVGLDGVLIMAQGFKLAVELGLDTFRGTRGWLYRFLVRHRLSLRRATTTGSSLPGNSVALIKKFFDRCNEVCNVL
jgi:hypothetical protein